MEYQTKYLEAVKAYEAAEAAEKNNELYAEALYKACIELMQAEAAVEAAETELFLAD